MADAGITTVPAAVGGVDFYSSLFGMPAENAVRLINWWPEVYGCTHRKGYREWVRGLPGTVGSLFTYHQMRGQDTLYAFSGDSMFDVTSQGVAPVAKITGLSTSIWSATMFANSAGTHKIFVSGGDDPIWMHQGPVATILFERLTAGNGTDPGTISGFNPKDAVDITIHQKRVWFVEKDTNNGWYLPPDQVFGVAKKFDFGPLFKRGGSLQALSTWTVDTGEGSDDKLVAFSTEGDIAVYAGIDPDSAETWALDGVYYAGAPISGQRFYTKVSGDLKFVTTQGLISMNSMLTSSTTTGPQSNIEAQLVQQFLSDQASRLGFLPGWDVKFFAPINMFLINIPSLTVEGSIQLAQNTVNVKWTTFLGLDATCFVSDYQPVPFFGDADGRVLQGWTGGADNVTPEDPQGAAITALVQQAYNYFGTPANNKQVGLYRPNFLIGTSLVYKSMISYDFTFRIPVVQGQPSRPGDPLWDIAIWDAAYWSGGLRTQNQWNSAEGLGFAGSLSMATRSDGEVIWVNTDFTVSTGGIL